MAGESRLGRLSGAPPRHGRDERLQRLGHVDATPGTTDTRLLVAVVLTPSQPCFSRLVTRQAILRLDCWRDDRRLAVSRLPPSKEPSHATHSFDSDTDPRGHPVDPRSRRPAGPLQPQVQGVHAAEVRSRGPPGHASNPTPIRPPSVPGRQGQRPDLRRLQAACLELQASRREPQASRREPQASRREPQASSCGAAGNPRGCPAPRERTRGRAPHERTCRISSGGSKSFGAR
jgi:hypothetical protein